MKRTDVVLASILVLVGCASSPGLRAPDTNTSSTASMSHEEFAKLIPSRGFLIRTNPLYAALAKPVRLNPIVYVDNGKVVLDQEPIHVLKDEGAVWITWSIGDASYFFPSDQSIVINPTPVSGPHATSIDCKRVPSQPANVTLVCLIKRPAGAAKYSYTVTVSDGTKSYTADPYIASD